MVCGGTDHHSRSSSWREPVVHPHSVHRQAATTSMLACYLAIATSWHMIDTNVDMITTKWHPIAHKCPFIENLLKICNLELMCCNCVAIGHQNVAILKGVGLVWLNTKPIWSWLQPIDIQLHTNAHSLKICWKFAIWSWCVAILLQLDIKMLQF